MKLGLPKSYLSPVDLPFNRKSLEGLFSLSPPGQDPGGEGVWLLLQGNQLLTTEGDDIPILPAGAPPLQTEDPPLYIGQWQGRPCRMSAVPKNANMQGLTLHSLMARDPQLPLPLLSLAGMGKMIQHWEQTSRYCGNCGQLMVRLPNDWGKRCDNCSSHHHPRIHPCAIGLVIKGDEILLVRKSEWADGRYGLVAGFVEFGECLEETMAREILEETGIQVENVRYIGSQCWPFPSQLMCGFVSDYVAGEIQIQEDELEDVCWSKLDQLPILPPRRSIARYLIDQAEGYLKNSSPISRT